MTDSERQKCYICKWYFLDADGGWCYMFKDEPLFDCKKFEEEVEG